MVDAPDRVHEAMGKVMFDADAGMGEGGARHGREADLVRLDERALDALASTKLGRPASIAQPRY